MAITTYDELKVAVEQTWPHRTNLSSFSADLIRLGESYINRKLRCREMETSAIINPSQVDLYVERPAGYMENISFSDDTGCDLTEVSAQQLQAERYSASATRPSLYLITSRIEFERLADQSYDYTMWYYKRLDLATDETNDVLTAHPDIYLFASLVQVEAFIKNDARVALWKSGLEEAIADANNQSRKTKRTLRTEFNHRRSNIETG